MYLIGPSCIRSNQSANRPRKQQEIEIKNEHKNIFTKVQNYLVEHHHIPRTIPIFKRYSDQLLDYFNHCYFAPLSYEDQKQSLQQTATVSTIRKKLKEKNLIIRLTDKGNNFYIGSADQLEKKAQEFFSTTNAFKELSSNPFNETLEQVTQLLNQLASKKLIYNWHRKKMMLDQKTCELAHLYFNPKTHKVLLQIILFIEPSRLLYYRRVYQFDRLKILFMLQHEKSRHFLIISYDPYSTNDVDRQPLLMVLL